ncbi:hypothetical protein FE407_07400 [Leuconostoc carnosum]|nr:hypothetical protein FE404_06915 [Leuconostoc carnosum]KAA8358095.1 hypothetical protein FE407_07400 [Leuconostoc carnosum]KAA8364593.1 hypothetical protein FE406_07395 [Leuconostoc carnosum]KAA8365467.1 hypothetical protein FE416_07705 [Leuconostoc carnosum]KAA8371497.1 hypothetical protein FE415_07895 [Leuconostoc carnosum]
MLKFRGGSSMKNSKQHYKLYKSGKFIFTVMVTAFATMAMGVSSQNILADTLTESTQGETKVQSSQSISSQSDSSYTSSRSASETANQSKMEQSTPATVTKDNDATLSSATKLPDDQVSSSNVQATTPDTQTAPVKAYQGQTSSSVTNNVTGTHHDIQPGYKSTENKIPASTQPQKKAATIPEINSKNGFITENGQTKYYQNGNMVTGEKHIDNRWYNFGTDGVQSKGLTQLAHKTVYYDNNTGQMHYGYLKQNQTYMFFDLFDGHAITGLRHYRDGLEYYGQDLKQVRNNYIKTNNTYYYFGANGDAIKGARYYDKGLEYYGQDYKQVRNTYAKTGNTYYYLSANGDAVKGVRHYDKGLEYYGQDYKQVRNTYAKTGNTYYYLGANGDAVKGVRHYDKGLEYYGQDYKQVRNTYAKTGNTYYYLSANGDAVKGFRKYSKTGLEYYGSDYKQYRNRYFNDHNMNSYHVNHAGDVDNVTLRHNWYSQLNEGYPEGCEATALQIALSNKNKYYSLPKIYNATGYGYHKTPSTGFYGNPKGVGSAKTETVFASKLASSMKKYDNNIVDITGASVNDVISELLNGNPIVTWGDYYWQLGRAFHVMTIVGYNNNQFLISDPYANSKREYYISTNNWHYVNHNNYALGWKTPSAMNVVVRG